MNYEELFNLIADNVANENHGVSIVAAMDKAIDTMRAGDVEKATFKASLLMTDGQAYTTFFVEFNDYIDGLIEVSKDGY